MSQLLPLGIRHILQQTGWTAHEVTVYSTLLEQGAMDLKHIAHTTSVQKSSIQYAIKQLHQRKVIRKFLINGVPHWKVHDVTALRRWISIHTEQFQEYEAAVQSFIDQYDGNSDKYAGHVECHEGTNAVKRALLALGRAAQTKEMFAVLLVDREEHEGCIALLQQLYIKLKTDHRITVKVLAATDESLELPIAKIKPLPKKGSDTQTIAMHIIGSTVQVMQVQNQKLSAITIDEHATASMMHFLFRTLWERD